MVPVVPSMPLISGAGSGVDPKIRSGTEETDGAEMEGGECRHSNIGGAGCKSVKVAPGPVP